MGIKASREDFAALEGYANIEDEARLEILKAAGLTPDE